MPEPEPAPVKTAEPVIEVPEVEVPEPAVVIERQAEVVPEAEPVEEPPVVEPVEPEAEPEPEPVDPNLPVPVTMPQRIADIRAETPATKFTPPPQRKTAPPPSAASVAAAPKPAAEKAEQVAAPQQTVSAAPSASQVQSWQRKVSSHVNRRLRHPQAGRSRAATGTAWVWFNIDRSGGVVSVRLSESSGSDILDQAALDLIWSSSPLPAPPPGLPEDSLTIKFPVEYENR
jgi:protein TonB